MHHFRPILPIVALALGATRVGPAIAADSPQEEAVIAEIKQIEQKEVQAVLSKDRAMLAKLWDEGFVVNSPANRVVVSTDDQTDRPVMQVARTGFTREVEHVAVRGNHAISMGKETVVSASDQPTVKRRYTNIWMKTGDSWKLIARHANVICAE